MTSSHRSFPTALLTGALLLGSAIIPTFANPVLSHKYTADPQPIVWNNRLYVYASNDDQSVNEADGYLIQAYTLVSTDDMANWVDHGEVFCVPRDWRNNTSTTGARAYAPGAAVRNNTVYLYPCGAGGPVGVVTAPRPEGPFTFRGPVLRNPAINGQNINRNNNHHAPIEFQGKWYMFYHDRRVANANNAPSVNQRNISVDSLVYNSDGTMREVVVTNDGVRQIKNFDPYKRIPASTINRQSGITTDSIRNEGVIVRSISNNDWIRLKGVDFKAGATGVTVRAASASGGGNIESSAPEAPRGPSWAPATFPRRETGTPGATSTAPSARRPAPV